jgi:polysaccharide deacetylase family protein (PEP-CTERM system associated)
MKILHIISSSGFFGAEAVVLSLLTKLKEDGQEGFLLCLKSAGQLDPELFIRAKENGITASVISCKSKFDLAAIRQLKKYVVDNNIEIIHAHGYKSDLYGILAVRSLKIPFVSTLHGWTAENSKVRIYGLIDKFVIRYADHVVSVSPAITEELKRLNMDTRRISFIPNGIDIACFSPPRRRRNLRVHSYLRRKFTIGTVGRLSVEKGHRHLIRALKEIMNKAPDIGVLIVGDGPLKGKLQDEVHALRLSDNVIFTGFQDDMVSMYKEMDMFVLPSLTEGVPIALLEAMSFELPVVATKVGGVPFVVGKDEGILVNAGKSEALSDAILSLIDNPSLRGTLGKNARDKVVREFSIDACYRKYREVYEDVLGVVKSPSHHVTTSPVAEAKEIGCRTSPQSTVHSPQIENECKSTGAHRSLRVTGYALRGTQNSSLDTRYSKLETRNILTIDVEDYFQVENFKGVINFSDWEKYELRVVKNTEKILEILAKKNVKATFFVLGWVAERTPELVEKIYKEGHEVACHGYAHQLIYKQTPQEFRADLRKAKAILENVIREPILGYRAPTYSITKESIWALDVLAEEGFKYDSSLFPIRRDKGGLVNAPRFPHRIYNGKNGAQEHKSTGAHRSLRVTGYALRETQNSSPETRYSKPETPYLWEFPISTVRMLNKNIAFSGGGYFRLLPYKFIKWSVEAVNREGYPAIVYLHPWEFDPQQPRVKADYISRFKHYVNIDKTEKKLKQLLDDFEFTTVREYLKTVIASPEVLGRSNPNIEIASSPSGRLRFAPHSLSSSQ